MHHKALSSWAMPGPAMRARSAARPIAEFSGWVLETERKGRAERERERERGEGKGHLTEGRGRSLKVTWCTRAESGNWS